MQIHGSVHHFIPFTRAQQIIGDMHRVVSKPSVTETSYSVKFEREKFYPGPGIEPRPLALRASALPLCHPGQLPIQGRINFFVPILSDLKTTNSVVFTSYSLEACIYIFE